MSLGPVMLDLAGTALSTEERELLRHPNVGGVVLFARNYADPDQIEALVAEIHALREPRLLVAVDQEGGRVQRFREGFTTLPPMARLGELHDRDTKAALAAAETLGWLLAAELRAVGVDLSFAPVLDLGRGISGVIDDRAYHRDPEIVAALGAAQMRGMRRAGMAAVGKHYPGHGSVAEDSHHERPVDPRGLEDILQLDGLPFERLAHKGLPAVMPAHVVYPQVDARPAGYSSVWLRDILRERLGFAGAVFSDDLAMAGAGEGSVKNECAARAEAALEAGCDMVLVCNDREAAVAVVDGLREQARPDAQVHLMRLHGHHVEGIDRNLTATPAWQQAATTVTGLIAPDDPELDLWTE
ncbi:MAG: beta-N-acetylhexosaminidase [Halofilum sp. (in: g-proteobacteria)]